MEKKQNGRNYEAFESFWASVQAIPAKDGVAASRFSCHVDVLLFVVQGQSIHPGVRHVVRIIKLLCSEPAVRFNRIQKESKGTHCWEPRCPQVWVSRLSRFAV